jgi:dolichol-phosphate mannosyltransferase
MLRTASGAQVITASTMPCAPGIISVVVPVLNEFNRLGTCLDKLITCGPEVREIIVVDGGSRDGTQRLIAAYAAADARVRFLDAAPTPPGWNGKAWGLDCGLRAASHDSTWISTIDADVRPRPALFPAVIAHAERTELPALSVATKQELGDRASSIVHPAMLATLVYRYGIPGYATTDAARVQANGQCFFARRDLLVAMDAFAQARTSVCEDVTVARIFARDGHRVGFYEAGDLVTVRMYETWQETWKNWPRSLTLRDGLLSRATVIGMAEIIFVAGLPLALASLLALFGHESLQRSVAFDANVGLLCMRIGIMAGTHRAYRNPAWTYWLSLFADLPVAVALIASAVRRQHVWRGRTLVISERIT